ncbi:unnamed protein product, partial [Pylaiella littoralis]
MAERGETTALCMSRIKGVASWQSLAGPTDPKEAKERSPRSLRAIYGDGVVNNAVHASGSLESATRELEFWFPAASRKPSSTGRTGAAPGDPEYKKMMLYMREQ